MVVTATWRKSAQTVVVASDSDVPDDQEPTKTWVQTLEDEHGVACQSIGKKRCRVCTFTVFLQNQWEVHAS
eukprot:4670049-Amphidinium_carterae.1